MQHLIAYLGKFTFCVSQHTDLKKKNNNCSNKKIECKLQCSPPTFLLLTPSICNYLSAITPNLVGIVTCEGCPMVITGMDTPKYDETLQVQADKRHPT